MVIECCICKRRCSRVQMVIYSVAYVNVEGSRVQKVIHSVVYVNVEGSRGHSVLHM